MARIGLVHLFAARRLHDVFSDTGMLIRMPGPGAILETEAGESRARNGRHNHELEAADRKRAER